MIGEENNGQKMMGKKLCARCMEDEGKKKKINTERIKHKAHGGMNSS